MAGLSTPFTIAAQNAASDDDQVLEEIIVTARKREEALQDLALSVVGLRQVLPEQGQDQRNSMGAASPERPCSGVPLGSRGLRRPGPSVLLPPHPVHRVPGGERDKKAH